MIKRKIDIVELEERFSKWLWSWIQKRRLRMVITLGFSALIFVLHDLPYLNLIFDSQTSLVISFVFGIFVLDIDKRVVFGMAMTCLILALPFSILGGYGQAEDLGNFTYGLLLAGVLKGLLLEK